MPSAALVARRRTALAVVATIVASNLWLAAPAEAATQTFTTTGASTWTVPAGVTSVTFEVWGAAGGSGAGAGPGAGANGGKVTATITVTAGEVLRLYIGAKGGDATTTTGGAGGAGGNGDSAGGAGGNAADGFGGGGGGGGSDVRQGGTARANIVLAAGGGGGGGAASAAGTSGAGGAGGQTGTSGASGSGAQRNGGGGTGATESAAGSGGSGDFTAPNGSAGSTGAGGAGGTRANAHAGGGGGGGGFFGGGGGGPGFDNVQFQDATSGGGGGASSCAGCGAATATNVTFASGAGASNSGNGKIVITFTVAQTITFAALADRGPTQSPFTVSATASSGLVVSFASTTATVCTVAGSTVTLVAVGTCSIRASQAGDATFAAATSVDRSFAVAVPASSGGASEVTLPSTSGGSSITTNLPVVLPSSGIVHQDVTLIGTGGCKLFIPKGTLVTTSTGAPFSGKLFAPSTSSGGQPIDNACTFTSSGGPALTFSSASASSRDAYALAASDLLTITLALPADATDPSAVRITKVDSTSGAVSTHKGTTSGTTISFTTTALGTFGVATVIDLARAASAPSVTSDIPVRFPSRAVGPAVTLAGSGGSLAIPAGTTATVKDLNAAFAGTLAPPSATSASGVSSAASLTANVPQGLRFDKTATLTLPLPAGQENAAFVPVFVGTGGSLTCLSGALSGSGIATEITTTSTYALLGSSRPAVAAASIAKGAGMAVRSGYHSAWAGQSIATTLCPTQQVDVTVKLRNTGDQAWIKGTPSQVVLGSNAAPGNTRDFDRGILIAPLYNTDRFATHAEASVRPGETGTFTFTLRAPSTAGTYSVHLRPVIEGQQWLEDEGIQWEMTVH